MRNKSLIDELLEDDYIQNLKSTNLGETPHSAGLEKLSDYSNKKKGFRYIVLPALEEDIARIQEPIKMISTF
jgi:hypothetical protein